MYILTVLSFAGMHSVEQLVAHAHRSADVLLSGQKVTLSCRLRSIGKEHSQIGLVHQSAL